MINYDKSQIKEQLSLDNIFDLLTEWGGDPEYTGFGILSTTICHNAPGEGSRKLYYYENSGLFKCYTGCDETFDIFQLAIKIAERQGITTFDLNEAVRLIAFKCGIQGSSIDASDLISNIDEKILNNYSRIQSIELKDYHITLQEYDDIILERLNYTVKIDPWLKEGICRTMNNTRYVLCDFNDKDSAEIIVKGMHKLLNAGYIPILAHAEIYKHLKLSQIGELVKSGVKIQIDMQSITGEFGFFIRKRANAILNARLAEVVCSDAHDLEKRPSQLNKCYQYLYKKFGKLYTRALVYDNAVKMLEATESGEN